MNPKKLKLLKVQSDSIYQVKISLSKSNPPFWAVLLTGFINEDHTVGSYTKIVGTSFDEIEGGELDNVTVHEILYICKQWEDYED